MFVRTLGQQGVFAVEGSGATFVHPLGLAMLGVCGACLVLLPRRYALLAFITMICFVSSRQCIAIAGFNLYFPRFMILVFGSFRILARSEWRLLRVNRLDLLVTLYGIVYFIAGAITWDFAATEMKSRSGYVTEVLGTYWLCRFLVRDLGDFEAVVRGLCVVAALLVVFFLVENRTGRNLFSIFGGVAEITAVREGRLRCQGAFGHPIMAGVFWAGMIPLFIGMLVRYGRIVYLVGIIAALGIVALSSSSTPVLGVATGLVGWTLFGLRRYARAGFAATGLLVIVLHFSMKAPVWSLIQRINVTPGSTGYHRYILVDGFIRHFHEWWLFGSRVGTGHWGHFTFDTANQFVAVGVAGGSPTLLLFFSIIAVGLGAAGRLQRIDAHAGWGVGVSVFVLCVCFLGISIWDQMHFVWSLPLAVASSLGFGPRRELHVPGANGLPSPDEVRSDRVEA